MTEWVSCGWRGSDTPDMGKLTEGRGQNLGRCQLLTSRQRQVFHGGDWQGAAHKAGGREGATTFEKEFVPFHGKIEAWKVR